MLRYFSTVSGVLGTSSRLTTRFADARRYVASTAERYDVIVADLFHPARDGAGTLYTREHFEMVQSRLAEHGLFCQWLPLFQLDQETLRLIIRTFLAVFPDSAAYLADYSVETPLLGLVARVAVESPDGAVLAARGQDPGLAAALAEVGLHGPLEVLGLEIANAAALARFAGEGPLNTDDRPLVSYVAPATVYRRQAPARDRLLAFLDAVQDGGRAPEDRDPRLRAYRRARDAFLRLGAKVDPQAGAEIMARRLPAPLLRIVRMSADFRPAYDPLLAISRHLHKRGRREEAHQLLTALEKANPARDEARQLRARLSSEG